MLRKHRFQLVAALLVAVAVATGVASATTRGFASSSSQATRFRVLYDFTGGREGWAPGALLRDADGNLYGTASGSGGNCHSGCGILFKWAPDGALTVLHTFAGPYGDGAEPSSPLIVDGSGNFYGTTYGGGAGDEGTVYELTADGRETLLHSFVFGGGEGIGAFGLLRYGGNLYGTTSDGGAYDGGTAFKLAPDGTETILHSFGSGTDGAAPYFGALVADKAGNFYGTTRYGGAHGQGTVYRLAPDGTETVLYSFSGSDGALPYAGVIMDQQGNLYGTTVLGGGAGCGGNGCGTVFKLTPRGTESVLHAFTGGSDGGQPSGCCLIVDGSGNLYGTTGSGGADYDGVAFKLAPDGTETVLHTFTGGADGHGPGGLTMDNRGNLYGSTFGGGAHGAGLIFELARVSDTSCCQWQGVPSL